MSEPIERRLNGTCVEDEGPPWSALPIFKLADSFSVSWCIVNWASKDEEEPEKVLSESIVPKPRVASER